MQSGEPDTTFTLFPEWLRMQGYTTFFTGKWHNNTSNMSQPFTGGKNIFIGGMHWPKDGGHRRPQLWDFDPTNTGTVTIDFHRSENVPGTGTGPGNPREVLVAAGLLIIGNTVRLELRARAEEIAVLRLLGADDAYVRRPFLYLGAAYGLLAALLAVGLNLLGMHALDSAVAGVSAVYGADFVLTGFPIAQVLPAVVAACVLGMVGAALAVGHHLRQSEVA